MSDVILTESENRIKLQRALKDLNLTGDLADDLAATNSMRADILNVVKEQFREDRVSAVLVQSASSLLKDIDEQHLKRQKLDVEKSTGDAALLIAQAAAAFMAQGNPYINRTPSVLPSVADPSVVATTDADIPTIELVEDHMYIGVQSLDYDEFSPEVDEEDDEDGDD